MPRDCRPQAQLRGLSFGHLYRPPVCRLRPQPWLLAALATAAWQPGHPDRAIHHTPAKGLRRAVHFPEHWGCWERGTHPACADPGFPSTGGWTRSASRVRVEHASRRQSGGPGGAGRERAQPGTGRRTRGRPCLAWQSPGSSEASRVGGCVLGAGDPTMSRSQNAASRWPPASWPLLMAQAPRKGPRPALLAWGAFVLRPSSHARLPDTVCAPEGQAPAPAPRTNTQTTPANAVHRNTLVSQTPGAEAWTPQGGVDVCPLWRA